MMMDTQKYINPLTDFGFKKLFGSEPNKDLLIDFLNQIIPDRQIADLTYASTEHFGKTAADRKAVFDLYCIGQKGERFIVEMQKAKQNFFKDRTVFYTSFPIQEQGKKQGWNYRLDPVYSVAILDFIFDDYKDEEELFHIVDLKDQHCRVFYDKLKLIYIELPKFRKGSADLKDRLDKWLYVLRHLWRLDSVPKVLNDGIFEKLFGVASLAAFSSAERQAYESSLKHYRDFTNVLDTAHQDGLKEGIEKGKAEGLKEGKAEGLREGIEKGKEEGLKEGKAEGVKEGIEKGKQEGIAQRNLEIAKALKNQGMPNDAIAKITDLPISEIEKL